MRTAFCPDFCGKCEGCKRSLEDLETENQAYDHLTRVQKPLAGIGTDRDYNREAALDHKGRP